MINSKSWPFEEARRILDKINHKTPAKGYVLFATGYGPSGLPHIGTFGEVARTTMVMNAFKKLSNIPIKLIAFSDDLDGLRKIPTNLPNQEMLAHHLHKPLTSVPDPFGKFESFAAYMNNKLCEFLDQFGFEYELSSATKNYKSGVFDKTLMNALENFDAIQNVMLPTLGSERQETYSPFLPICPISGKVLQVAIIKRDIDQGTITYLNEEGREVLVSIKGGNCKMQWKADWALRWAAFEVDYEMHGKDLIPSEKLSAQICEILGKTPPVTYHYELFLDEKGQKISKSKGNGLTIDEWLTYAPTESLSLYMYQSPKKAKKLYFAAIPKNVDDYITFTSKYNEDSEDKYDNPIWHIHSGNVAKSKDFGINFSLLLNLACACNPEDKSNLWSFIQEYCHEASPSSAPFLDRLTGYAIRYYNDFIKPNKIYKTPTSEDIILLNRILEGLKTSPIDAENTQNLFYDIARELNYTDLKLFFKNIYQLLLGQENGPRLGTFVMLYGIQKTEDLIKKTLNY